MSTTQGWGLLLLLPETPPFSAPGPHLQLGHGLGPPGAAPTDKGILSHLPRRKLRAGTQRHPSPQVEMFHRPAPSTPSGLSPPPVTVFAFHVRISYKLVYFIF